MKNILFYSLAILSLLSCKEEGGIESETPEEIIFSAEARAFTSRVASDGRSWSNGDAIGTFMLHGNSDAVLKSNVEYACANDGEKVQFVSQSPLTIAQEDGEVRFMAYYPYNKSLSGCNYTFSLANQSAGTESFDLMQSLETELYVAKDGAPKNIPLTFEHCLSKVIINFVDTDGNPANVDDVEMDGFPLNGIYNLNERKLVVDSKSANVLKPFVGSFKTSCEAIIMPASLDDSHAVVYKYNGKSYRWLFSNNNKGLSSFEPGYKYEFTHVVATGDPADVEQNGNSSSPWEDGEEIDDVVNYFDYDIFPYNTESAYTDTEFVLTFSGEVPRLGTSGFIRIYRLYDDKLVDEINMAERQQKIAATGPTVFNTWMDIVGLSDYRLIVNYHAAKVDGYSVVIKPHSQVLDYESGYYVTIDKDAIVHKSFKGIDKHEWFFKTRRDPGAITDVIVSHKNPEADFYTIQGAIDHFSKKYMATQVKTITLESGVYEEIVNIRNISNLTVKGQGNENTEIRYDNNAHYNVRLTDGCKVEYLMERGENIPCDDNGNTMGGGRANMLIAGNSDKIRFEDICFRNTYPTKTQCEVVCIRNKSDNATAFIRCNFLGRQDTLQPGGGFNWFYQCYVEGDTDFVWGGNSACLFEECELKMITSGGRGFNARVGLNKLGYVFYKSELTVADGVDNCRLMEGSGTSGYDNISYIHTTIDKRFINDGICSTSKILNPRPESMVDGDIDLQDGCKIFDCTYIENGKEKGSIVDSGVYGVEYIFEISNDDYDKYFKDRCTILKDYDDVDWFSIGL